MTNDSEEIKNRLNIVDVLGEYIRLDKAGANWKALCPFHNEKSPSFSVSEDKQIWHCFGCGKGGDIFGFVMEMEGIEFREALKILAEKAGVKLQNFNPKKAEEKNRTYEILETAAKFYEVQLWKGSGKEKILNYLRGRGLKDETIREFRLGYAPRGWRHALFFLTKRGYKTEEIEKTGLLVKKEKESRNDQNNSNYYDRFRERIMFPISDYSGRVVGFSARVSPGGNEAQAKYINTPETEVYHKSNILYGVDKARQEIKKSDNVILVEGNMDVIAAYQAGLKNVVAVSGTALTPSQIKILKRYTTNVTMFFDMDNAGEIATKKSLKLCFSEDMHVKVVTLPSGKDAADLARDDPKKLNTAIGQAMAAIDYLLDINLSKFDRNSSEGKRKISEEILEMIASFENAIEKSHWIKKIGDALNISETALTDELKKVNLKERISRASSNKQESQNVISREKIDILLDELIGLALAERKIWEEAVGRKEELKEIEDSLLSALLFEGKKIGFDFEKLGQLLTGEEKGRADNLFFQKKYQIDENNNLTERIISDSKKEFERIFFEIKKEMRKNELEKITGDLRLAEEKKDKVASQFLKEQFKKISKELYELEAEK
jgi:DNA primase